MARVYYNVDDMVSDIRSSINEENQDAINTTTDILPAMNRAQEYAFDIYARRYPEPLLAHASLSLVDGQNEYPLPENIFEDRLLKLEVQVPGSNGTSNRYYEIPRVSYRDISMYEVTSKTPTPYAYCLFGRTIRILPNTTATYSCRLWYVREPERLVTNQGRITVVNAASNYMIVDSAGSDLSTLVDSLSSYINVVDAQTGEIKQSFQIANITNNKIQIRTTPTRSTVLNRTISTSIDTTLTNPVAADDRICLVQGVCVPFFGSPTSNFIIQYTVAELTRRLGGDVASEEEILAKFEQQVERAWVGRESDVRVQRLSRAWGGRGAKVIYPSQSVR